MLTVLDISHDIPRHETRRYKFRELSDIASIVLHHSGAKEGDAYSLARKAVEEGKPSIQHHYVIGTDASVMKTNSERVITRHCERHDRSSISVCVIGNFEVERMTPQQVSALLRLLPVLCFTFRIPVDLVRGHSEVDPSKRCPGRYFLPAIIRRGVETNLDILFPGHGLKSRS